MSVEVEKLDTAWQRALERLRATAFEDVDEGETLSLSGKLPTMAFAGTDLPSEAVLRALENLTDGQFRGMVERQTVDVQDLRGIAVMAFLFGWESRS